jgi:steroid delta-isomerase-like uncharacterized protein
VFNKGNLKVVDELSAPNLIDHTPNPGAKPGVQGIKDTVTETRTAFPDCRITVDELLTDGNTVVARITFTGTHKGPLAGIPATGKKIKVTGVDVVKLSNGRATEVWHYGQERAMMEQLGLMPPQQQR